MRETGLRVRERGVCAVDTGVENRDTDAVAVEFAVGAHRAHVVGSGRVATWPPKERTSLSTEIKETSEKARKSVDD